MGRSLPISRIWIIYTVCSSHSIPIAATKYSNVVEGRPSPRDQYASPNLCLARSALDLGLAGNFLNFNLELRSDFALLQTSSPLLESLMHIHFWWKPYHVRAASAAARCRSSMSSVLLLSSNTPDELANPNPLHFFQQYWTSRIDFTSAMSSVVFHSMMSVNESHSLSPSHLNTASIYARAVRFIYTQSESVWTGKPD